MLGGFIKGVRGTLPADAATGQDLEEKHGLHRKGGWEQDRRGAGTAWAKALGQGSRGNTRDWRAGFIAGDAAARGRVFWVLEPR